MNLYLYNLVNYNVFFWLKYLLINGGKLSFWSVGKYLNLQYYRVIMIMIINYIIIITI